MNANYISRFGFHFAHAAIVSLAAMLILGGAVGESSLAHAAEPDGDLLRDARDNFVALPTEPDKSKPAASPAVVELGRKLFFDPRISEDGTVSCMRCHQVALYATDGLPKSRGFHDVELPRNAPTILNSGLYFKEHWRGDFNSVEDQAKHALLGMGFAEPEFTTAMRRIQAIPEYTRLFREAFPNDPDPVSPDNWGTAIGAYERTLTTPSRFDDFLHRKQDALSADEQRGLRVFMDTGCADCHNGVAIGGNEFEKFGIYVDYWKETHSDPIDQGRYDLTKKEDDRYVFKVPSLRNVAMTPPYFHDGSVGQLPEAVRIMAKLQLDKTLSDDEIKSIIAFLNSLTGPLPENYANSPVLPAAGYVPPPAKPQSAKQP